MLQNVSRKKHIVDFHILTILEFLWTIAVNLLEDHLLQFSAQNSYLWVLNSTKNLQIGKCDILTYNRGLFSDSKLFLKITKKLDKVYNSHEYLT